MFSFFVLRLYVIVVMPAYRTTIILLIIKRQINQSYCLPYDFYLLILILLLLVFALVSPFFLLFYIVFLFLISFLEALYYIRFYDA